MDESTITGESDFMKKVPIFSQNQNQHNESSFLISGTKGRPLPPPPPPFPSSGRVANRCRLRRARFAISSLPPSHYYSLPGTHESPNSARFLFCRKILTPPCVLAYSRILVMDGSGKILVCSVGSNTQLGMIRARLEEQDDPTPLQQKLEAIAEQIGYVGTIAAALTMFALLAHLGVNIYLGHQCGLCLATLNKVINAFMIAVTIIVVAVPEGKRITSFSLVAHLHSLSPFPFLKSVALRAS